MNEKSLREQLAATVSAAAALNGRQSELTARVSVGPRPGDVFLSRRTADYPVQWLMIEKSASDARVVPLDEHPYAGSRDLELAPESLGGFGVVRCDFDAWLDVSELEPELRTGALGELEVARVRHKRRAIEDETLEPSLLEEVVDGDPQYSRWLDETLRPALDALTGRQRETADTTVASPPVIAPPRRWPMAIAAAIFLALTLPLAWQVHRLGGLVERQEGRVATLQDERRSLEEQLAEAESERETSGREVGRLERALSDAADASKRALDEQQERFEARLRRILDERAVINAPSYVLGKLARTRSFRGEAEVIAPGDARRFTLSLEVPDPEPYPRYRLRIVDRSNGDEVWKTDELTKLGGKWLRLDLPTEFLEAGEYDLEIYGLTPEGPKRLKERYAVRFER